MEMEAPVPVPEISPDPPDSPAPPPQPVVSAVAMEVEAPAAPAPGKAPQAPQPRRCRRRRRRAAVPQPQRCSLVRPRRGACRRQGPRSIAGGRSEVRGSPLPDGAGGADVGSVRPLDADVASMAFLAELKRRARARERHDRSGAYALRKMPAQRELRARRYSASALPERLGVRRAIRVHRLVHLDRWPAATRRGGAQPIGALQ